MIEPEVGGRFYELFDDAGNGALHATVHYVKAPEEIRFTGPLGLSGNAITMVHTVTFAAEGDQTRVKLVLDAAGHVEEGWPTVVDQVWDHFLRERFAPFVAAGKHRE